MGENREKKGDRARRVDGKDEKDVRREITEW